MREKELLENAIYLIENLWWPPDFNYRDAFDLLVPLGDILIELGYDDLGEAVINIYNKDAYGWFTSSGMWADNFRGLLTTFRTRLNQLRHQVNE